MQRKSHLYVQEEELLLLQVMLPHVNSYELLQDGRNELRGQHFIEHSEHDGGCVLLDAKKKEKDGINVNCTHPGCDKKQC